MKLARFDDIVAIHTRSGDVIGFHAHNLQVARLDKAVWTALKEPAKADAGVRAELEQWNLERDPRGHDSGLPQKIRSITINVAQICNLKCTYCAAGGDGTYGDPSKEIDLARTYDQLRMLLHDVPGGEAFQINFLGGEPLIVPEIIRSIARFARLQVAGREIELIFSIVTNGTLINTASAELLASLRCHVTISLDGPPEINDRQRITAGGLGSTFRTLKGIGLLQKYRDRLGSLRVGAVFGRHHTDALATYQFLRPFDFDSYKFDFAPQENDGAASRAFAESMAATADLAFQEGGETELRKFALFDSYFKILDNQSRIHNHCGAGKSHLQIDARGRFYACQWFVNDPAEQVGQGLTLDHERLKNYADPLTELNDCRGCWARHLCGGGCMFAHKTKTGSKHAKDDVFCQRMRTIIAKGIEHYAQARIHASAHV